MERTFPRNICYYLILLILLIPWGPAAGGQEEKGISARMQEGKREFSRMTCQGLERAIASFQEVLAHQADSAEGCAWLGRAEAHLGAILEREGKDGKTLVRQGMSHARKAYELSPHSADSCLAMADLLLLTSNFAEAKRMAEPAQRADPENPWTSYLLWKATDPDNPESSILQGALSGASALALGFLDQGNASGESENGRRQGRPT
jgi:tetratricopeptide (TPR) repeat protein